MFRAILAKKLTKIANMRSNKFPRRNFNLGIKNPEFNAEESAKRFIKQTLLLETFAHSNKSQKLYFSLKFFLYCFRKTFLNFCHRIRNGYRIVRFFPISWPKSNEMTQNQMKNFCFKCVREFNFAVFNA